MSYRPSRRPDISYGSYQPNYPDIPSAKPIPAPTFNTGRLPSGGGRLNPLMARESPTSYGSYPPRSTTREELIPTREHSIRSYNQNPYGDFSPSRYPRPSTAPMRGDPGYGTGDKYPSGTRMDREYKSYKEANRAAGAATKQYKNEANSLKLPRNRNIPGASGPVKNHFYYPQDHAKLGSLAERAEKASKIHCDARTKFNHDHVGRVSQRSSTTHRKEAEKAAASRKYHEEYKDAHRYFS